MKIFKFIITSLLFILLFSSLLFSKESVDVLNVVENRGSLLVANKGELQGIQKNWLYDVKRIVKEDTFSIGIGVVKTVEDAKCYLTSYSKQEIKVLPGDLLFKNIAGTERLIKTQSIDFWNSIHNKYDHLDELAFVDGRLFGNCRVNMKDGNILKPKYLTVKSDQGVFVPKKYTSEDELIPLKNIRSIKTSTGNYAFFGSLIGAAIGGTAVLFLHKDKVEIDNTYYFTTSANSFGNVIGWTKMMKVVKKDYRLPLMTRLGLVGSGYLAGALIGYAFKGRWREIYTDGNHGNRVSLKFAIEHPQADAMALNLKWRF